MISISGNHWEEYHINQRIIDKIRLDHEFSEIVAKLIAVRKFSKLEIDSINNNIEIINPFLMNGDFEIAQKILKKSIKENEKIFIIGDYDVDGCISTSIMTNFLKHLDAKVEFYIPNRFLDGYGATLDLVKKVEKKKPSLIIMLDCGSNAKDSIEYLNSKNIKTIIIDHHEIFKPYPKANCIINPKKNCDYSEFDYFCTAALTYFFVETMNKKWKVKYISNENLVNVLLATICDVMPLRKLNRIIAIHVLKTKINKNYLFNKVFEIMNIKKKVVINDFGFLIGPILNAAGRLKDPNIVVNLLTDTNINKKDPIINNLISLNKKRKEIENISMKEIDLNSIELKTDNVLVEYEKNLNEGLIGIIASKLKDYFNKPSVVLTKSKDIYKASARSTSNFNIGKYIKKAIENNIILNGGGHNLAAGFTIKKKKITQFKKYINEVFNKKNSNIKRRYISKISFSAINNNFLKEIRLLSPFGEHNSNPLFLIEKVKIIRPKIINHKYVSFYVKSKYGKMIQGISFGYLHSKINEHLINNKKEMNLIVQLNENQWNNKKNLQLIVSDLIVLPNKA
jgi:single-stranded-DNA-specific exonuclease